MVMPIEHYLKENIDDNVKIKPWNEKNIFPVFIRDAYIFYEMMLLKTPCLLMEAQNEMPGIDNIQKHINQIRNLTDRHIVLLYKEITRYRRKSLIRNRISFMVEDGQIYLPFLGLVLNKVQENVDSEMKHFTTSAQIAYLYFLYHKDDVLSVTEFAKKLGLTNMTASRALNDLYHANLITYKTGGKTGRNKEYKRIPDSDYYFKGRAYLKSPVRKSIYVMTKPLGALTAGLDALAKLSILNPPNHPVTAVGRKQFDTHKFEIIENRDLIKDVPLMEVQLWDYDPNLFSDKHHVDPLSLYVSLKEDMDERIEQALEEVLRGEPWYTD